MMDQQEIKKRVDQILEEELGKDRTYRYKIKFPSQYELYKEILNYPKEEQMPKEYEPITNWSIDEPEELGQEYTGTLKFHSDRKHIIVKLGCREYICHNKTEVLKCIEKEVAELIESRKRQQRAFARRKRLMKSIAKKEPKKKVKAPSLKLSKGDTTQDS